MATRGRKPKPTAMKELEGNPGKHPLNTSEPKPNKKAPACPKWLEPEAKKEWRRLAKQILMIEKLNERITIEKSTVVTDKVGNHRNTWEEYFTCFAYASTYQAQEEEGEVTAEQKSVVFTVRWCSETGNLTSTGYRIRFREQLYNIESVDPMNYQKKILKIHCRLERRQPDEQNRQHR